VNPQAKKSSSTTKPPWTQASQPKGTGDDPITLQDLDPDSSEPDDDDEDGNDEDDWDRENCWCHYQKKSDKDKWLEGEPPAFFDSDWSKTLLFLVQFKAFIMMNPDATITCNTLQQATYFLTRVWGPEVKGWTLQMYDLLDKIHMDPWGHLPFGINVWEVLEQEFHWAFEDYTGRERALDKLAKLRMKNGHIDEYIVTFHQLLHCARIEPNNPIALKAFARGLPKPLIMDCIKIEDPEMFNQWAKVVQWQHHNYLQEQSIFSKKDSLCPPNNLTGRSTRLNWRRNNQTTTNQKGTTRAQPCLPTRDPNAMDMSMSAQVSKATTEADKECYQKEGRYYECRKQGHIICACPTWKNASPLSQKAKTEETLSMVEEEEPPSYEKIAKILLRYSDEERAALSDIMSQGGEELDFGQAWVQQTLRRP
jgi:hypothetical protein